WRNGSLEALVEFLVEHRAEAGDGANFTETIWNQATQKMVPYYSKGAVKTPKVCRSKWGWLKDQFMLVTMIKNTSGLSWDDDHGVNMPVDNGVWAEFTAV
ncbi:hypothetical protein K439DRAFT_1267532, partial [Ramaria rubella]